MSRYLVLGLTFGSMSVLASAAVSCSDGPSQPASADCVSIVEAPLASEVAQADTTSGDWRDNFEAFARSLPPDSLVRVAVMYRSPPTEVDRQLLAELDAVITYEFTILPALSIRIPAKGFAVLARNERVVLMSVGSPIVPFGCR